MSETKEGRIWRRLPLIAAVLALLLVASFALVGITRAGSLLGVPSSLAQQKTTGANTVTSDLAAKFAAAGPDAKLQYWVVMADQADTSNNIPNSQWAEKGWYVYNVLIKKAAETQKPVITRLQELVKSGDVTSMQSFWIINLVAVTGNLKSANVVSTQAGVATVKVPPTGQIYTDVQGNLSDSAVEAIDQAAQDIQAAKKGDPLSAPLSPFIVQHNINEVHAPQAWTLGYDGTGITIGSMDTGTRWTHEALNARYRGNVAPPDPVNIHDYDWLDGYGTFTTPTDNNGHGSHTMGTALGTSPNATYGNIGVGKGAMWMTVRICATSSCDSTPIMNGFQWTLAPYRVNGTQPNPAYRPRVSNNSWGGSGCDTGFDTAVLNWINAGIFPDFSTGNSGPGAGTVGTPANSPGSWGTGNLNTSVANWAINSSSSRGPSACDP
ncbi:MAG: S8 family serine peptidase, partial [Chloroflexia bacterium]